jgi:hypothetical protein
MGTPARCMILSGVSSMGSNVLKYTRDTSLCVPPVPLGACQTQGAVEEELPHQAVPLQVKIGLDVERFHRVRIVGVGLQYNHAVLFTTRNHI